MCTDSLTPRKACSYKSVQDKQKSDSSKDFEDQEKNCCPNQASKKLQSKQRTWDFENKKMACFILWASKIHLGISFP